MTTAEAGKEKQRKTEEAVSNARIYFGSCRGFIYFATYIRNWEKLEINPLMTKVDLREIMNFLPKNINNLSY